MQNFPSSEKLWDTTKDFMQGSDMIGFAFFRDNSSNSAEGDLETGPDQGLNAIIQERS